MLLVQLREASNRDSKSNLLGRQVPNEALTEHQKISDRFWRDKSYACCPFLSVCSALIINSIDCRLQTQVFSVLSLSLLACMLAGLAIKLLALLESQAALRSLSCGRLKL